MSPSPAERAKSVKTRTASLRRQTPRMTSSKLIEDANCDWSFMAVPDTPSGCTIRLFWALMVTNSLTTGVLLLSHC